MVKQLVNVRGRFWVESALAALTGALAILTLVSREWLEAFGLDPDGGNGAAEWIVVSVLFGCWCALSIAVRFEWRKAAPSSA